MNFIDDKTRIAFDRYQIINPILASEGNDKEMIEKRREVAIKTEISEKTLSRYVKNYQTNGIDGLLPHSCGRPGPRVLRDDIYELLKDMRIEQPKRSVATIIRSVELLGIVEEGALKRSTVQDAFERDGLNKRQVKMFSELGGGGSGGVGGSRFQRDKRNELWQGDTKFGPYIDGQRTFLISYIDDATRLITNAEFYQKENTETVMDSLRHGIVKYGAPKDLYLDNGKPFKAESLRRATSMLGIRKMHAKPYHSWSKGKVEKYHQFVDAFITELGEAKVSTLQELNENWQNFLHSFYQTKPHDGLPDDMSPMKAFEKDDAKLRYIDSKDLDMAFLMVEANRTVDKSGCITLNSKKYTGDGMDGLKAQVVQVVWKPTDRSVLFVQYKKSPLIKVTEYKIPSWLPKRPTPPSPSVEKKPGSIVLDAAKAGRDKFFKEMFGDQPAQNADGVANDTAHSENVDLPSLESDSSYCRSMSEAGKTAREVEEKTGQATRRPINFKDMEGSTDPDQSAKNVRPNHKPSISFASLSAENGDDD
jgi:transposase InsO family protein